MTVAFSSIILLDNVVIELKVSTKLILYFIQPMRCNLHNVLYYYQRSTCFGRFFRPSSGAYKTVCGALGIVMVVPTHPRQR